MSRRVPPPQPTEQAKVSLQDDQAGHACVLHGSSFVRLDKPLSKLFLFVCSTSFYQLS